MPKRQFLTPRQMAEIAAPIVEAQGGRAVVARALGVGEGNLSNALNHPSTRHMAMLRRLLALGGYVVAETPAYEVTR